MTDVLDTLFTLYLGGTLYAVLDITATCRMADCFGPGLSPARRWQALLEALVWPIALPCELLLGHRSMRGGDEP